jgi:glycosidase
VNVEDQKTDPGSVLTLTRDLIALRRDTPELQTGAYQTLETQAGVWAWRRGQAVVAAVNMSDEATTVDGIEGHIRIATDRGRDGESVVGGLRLRPWEGVIIAVR